MFVKDAPVFFLLLNLGNIILMANELKARFGFLVQDGGRGTAITDIFHTTFLLRNSLLQLTRPASDLKLTVAFFKDFTESGIRI